MEPVLSGQAAEVASADVPESYREEVEWEVRQLPGRKVFAFARNAVPE